MSFVNNLQSKWCVYVCACMCVHVCVNAHVHEMLYLIIIMPWSSFLALSLRGWDPLNVLMEP